MTKRVYEVLFYKEGFKYKAIVISESEIQAKLMVNESRGLEIKFDSVKLIRQNQILSIKDDGYGG